MVFGAFKATFMPFQVGVVIIINNLNFKSIKYISTLSKKMIVESIFARIFKNKKH